MRFGVCSGCKNIKIIKNGGFDYLEGNLTDISRMTDEEVKETDQILRSNGMRFETTNCFFPGEIKLTGDNKDIFKIKDYAQRAIERAVSLGVETLVMGSGNSRRIPDGFDRQEAHEQLLEVFFALGEIAYEHSVMIAIEPLNRSETNVLNSVTEAFDFSLELAHPNVAVLVDILHFHLENESLLALERCGDKLQHIHFSNPLNRRWPKPEDEYDYEAFANTIKKIGYNKRISIEAMSDNMHDDILPALEVMKKYF